MEEVILLLSSAQQLANETIQEAQRKYKLQFDGKAQPDRLQIGEWVLIKFSHEELGKNRKLSRPLHGPYRIITMTNTDITVIGIYFPNDGSIKVHQG